MYHPRIIYKLLYLLNYSMKTNESTAKIVNMFEPRHKTGLALRRCVYRRKELHTLFFLVCTRPIYLKPNVKRIP